MSCIATEIYSSHVSMIYIQLSLFFSMCVFLWFSEIARVRASLFQINGVKKEPLVLPEPEGPVTTLTEKVYVPVKEHPDVSDFIKSWFWGCSLKNKYRCCSLTLWEGYWVREV